MLDPNSLLFAERQREIHDAARARPPKITIYYPHDASDEEVEEDVGRAEDVYPGIGVEHRRYKC